MKEAKGEGEPRSRRSRTTAPGWWAAAGLVMLASLAGAWAAEEAAPDLQEEIQALVDRLETRPVDCPAELLAPEILDRTYCAKIDLEFDRLRKAVQKHIRKNRGTGAVQLGKWSELDGGLHAAPVLLGSLVLRLVFDPRSAMLLVIPHDGCLEGSGAMSPGVFEWTAIGLEEPERLSYPTPEFPERARAVRATGVVVLQAIVLKDGTTAEHCVLHAQPIGYGFVESALSALKRSRYKPAMLDGEPVEILLTVANSFSYGR